MTASWLGRVPAPGRRRSGDRPWRGTDVSGWPRVPPAGMPRLNRGCGKGKEAVAMPTVTIFQPADGTSVPPGQPVQVTGRATDKAGAEPAFVDTVTVQVDSGPPVEARLTRVP